ncbi:hypothetical protein DXG01_016975, partial [Tephrocybe rancida]
MDVADWELRTDEECREIAEKYRSAHSEDTAAAIVKENGIRWSELLRLPYYKPSSYLVVDPMHNLFLGIVKEHFQDILGYDPEMKKRSRRKKQAPTTGIKLELAFSPDNPMPEERKAANACQGMIHWLRGPIGVQGQGDEFEAA